MLQVEEEARNLETRAAALQAGQAKLHEDIFTLQQSKDALAEGKFLDCVSIRCKNGIYEVRNADIRGFELTAGLTEVVCRLGTAAGISTERGGYER